MVGDHQWGQRLLGEPQHHAKAFLGALGKQAGCFPGQEQTALEPQLLFMINSRKPKDPTVVNSGVSGNGGTFEARRDTHVGNKSYSWNPTPSCTHIIISSSAQFAPSPQPPHKFPQCAPQQGSAETGIPLEMTETHPQILPHHHWVTLTMPLGVFSTGALV